MGRRQGLIGWSVTETLVMGNLHPVLSPKPKEHPLTCFECGAPMKLQPTSVFGRPYYTCINYPACPGTHSAHMDGTPMGTPADQKTKSMRMVAHTVFDRLWKERKMSRSGAYTWMQHTLGLNAEDAHIGNFDVAQCKRLVEAVWVFLGEPEQ